MTLMLDQATVEAIARRVVELMCQEGLAPSELVDAAEIARRFGVSRDYVYEHADKLGAIRLSDGPRARLRFDPERVADALNSPSPTESTPRRAKPRHRRRGDLDLLPIHTPARKEPKK